jgi:single-stranded-DNA-specific exonuclease
MINVKKTIRQRQSGQSDQLPADLHPVLRRVYLARGILSPDQLDRSTRKLLLPDKLSGIDSAARRVAAAVQSGDAIMIVGDFDADGATGTAVAIRALRAMGCANLSFCVPNRFEFGYGLSRALVESREPPYPAVLITVDNGISSVDGTAAAVERGMDVVITDHHLPGPELPAAHSIVNPNQHGDKFPSKAIAGVGVVFYLMTRVRSVLREAGWFTAGRKEPNLADLLDLVALGTVADLVPLDENNRVLVHNGVERIKRGRCVPGILALLNTANRHHARLTAADLGFAVAPRLNAAGRLEDMAVGIECLLSDDLDTAMELAAQLNELNLQRRSLQEQMQEEALALTAKLIEDLRGKPLPSGLCLFDPGWHQGIVGLVASRIKDAVHRPVIAFAPENESSGILKGSARSIPGIHIRDVLATVDAANPGLINAFGGHAMAAGLSLSQDEVEAFYTEYCNALDKVMEPHHLDNVLLTDGVLEAAELNLETAQLLRSGGPWGQKFPEPVFEGRFAILEQRIVGQRHLKMTVQQAGSDALDAIAFNTLPGQLPDNHDSVGLVYRLDVNEFRSRQSAQLIVEYIFW